ALAIIGTGFLVDTSFAETARQATQRLCDSLGGTFIVENNGNYSCTLPDTDASKTLLCTRKGDCSWSICEGGRGCITRPVSTVGEKKPRSTRIDTVPPGTCADRGTCGRRAPTLGAPVNGIAVAPSKTAPAGAPVNSVLNAAAPSPTAPAASTGAALNAAT